MQCLSCQKENGGDLGLCPECLSARSRTKISSRDLPPHFSWRQCLQNDPRTYLAGMVLCVLLVLGIPVIYSALDPVLNPVWDFEVRQSGKDVVVQAVGSANEVTYSYGEALHLDLRLFDIIGMTGGPGERTGSVRWLVTLSDNDYRTYERDYLRTGQCAASFVNPRVRHYFLVGENKEASAKLRDMPLKQGDRITLDGRSLVFKSTKWEGTEYSSQLMTIPGSPLLVKRIVRSDPS